MLSVLGWYGVDSRTMSSDTPLTPPPIHVSVGDNLRPGIAGQRCLRRGPPVMAQHKWLCWVYPPDRATSIFEVRMITFWRDGTKLKVEIDPKMPDKKVMYLYWDCSNEWYAELLMRQLDKELEDLIQRIRKAEYNSGWKDAKSKKVKKRDWFYNSLSDGTE